MNRVIFTGLNLLLISIMAHADDVGSMQVDEQLSNEVRCRQIIVQRCLSDSCVNARDNTACRQICEENAKNQCLQAGE